MPLPLAAIGGGSALLGLAGSLFGSGTEQLPQDPRILEIYRMLSQQAEDGLTDEAVNDLIEQAKRNIGNEANAATADQRRRIALQGGGIGAQQVGAGRINSARLNAIGGASTQASLADEQAKQEASRLLAGFAPNLQPQFQQTGQGFSSLFGAGINLLLNRPDNNGGGSGGGRRNSGINNIFDFEDPFRNGRV